jgi:hypothetical protein
MKKFVKAMYWMLIPAAIIMVSLNLFAAPVSDNNSFEFRNNDRVSGTLDFQVRTTTHNGVYEPRNCFVVWICDEDDNFIRTLVRRAWSYRQHLVKWNQMTGGNYDNSLPYPLTGASYNSHVTTNVSWDLTDIDAQTLLPDGNYRVYVEFTENNSANGGQADGPWTMYEFTKGPTAESQFPADTTYFHDVEIIFSPVLPTVAITSPTDGETITAVPFDVVFDVQNLGDEMLAVSLNGNILSVSGNSDPVQVNAVEFGENVIRAELLDGNALPFDPAIFDEITLHYGTGANDDDLHITNYELQNYPNPFNPETTIYFETFELSNTSQIEIFNSKGQLVDLIDLSNTTENSIVWNAEKFASGIYFYKLNTPDSPMQKMVLMK